MQDKPAGDVKRYIASSITSSEACGRRDAAMSCRYRPGAGRTKQAETLHRRSRILNPRASSPAGPVPAVPRGERRHKSSTGRRHDPEVADDETYLEVGLVDLAGLAGPVHLPAVVMQKVPQPPRRFWRCKINKGKALVSTGSAQQITRSKVTDGSSPKEP